MTMSGRLMTQDDCSVFYLGICLYVKTGNGKTFFQPFIQSPMMKVDLLL